MSLGLVGLWGEWHTWPYDRDLGDGYPNLMPTDATIRTLIGAHDAAFANIQLEAIPVGGHRKRQHQVPRRLLAVQAMARRAAQEHDPVHVDERLGRRLPAVAAQHRHRKPVEHPVHRRRSPPEIQGSLYANWPGGGGQVDDVLAATELTHITWRINQTGAGGYSTSDPKVSAGVRKMGYNLHIPQANFNPVASGNRMKVGVTVQNNGVAPFYYPWTVAARAAQRFRRGRQDLGHELGPAPRVCRCRGRRRRTMLVSQAMRFRPERSG